MRRFVACLVAALLSTVAVDGSTALSALDASSTNASPPDRAVVDRLVFEVPLARFRVERSRAKRTHRWLITSTDGCSAPLVGSSGKSFDFRLACERHDLAYANYPLLSRVDHAVV
ncbi:MAG: phospholipase A2 [Acidimicrobiia bacterium]